jgi:hypothetical protein
MAAACVVARLVNDSENGFGSSADLDQPGRHIRRKVNGPRGPSYSDHVGGDAAALRRGRSRGDLAAITTMIDDARDRQRWDKMVFWSKVLCRSRMYTVGHPLSEPVPRGGWAEVAYDEAKARQARRRAGG